MLALADVMDELELVVIAELVTVLPELVPVPVEEVLLAVTVAMV